MWKYVYIFVMWHKVEYVPLLYTNVNVHALCVYTPLQLVQHINH